MAREITRRASRQTYLIVRWLVDRERIDDAFRAYAYFRWVDDSVDAPTPDPLAHQRFLSRQAQLLRELLAGAIPEELQPEEQMLADVVANRDRHPGLPSYLENMMAVMEFDVARRGRLITQAELDRYTHLLATAVWDVIEYFIGHDHPYPDGRARTRAPEGAHIIHMLRDTYDDLPAGYFNIPLEVLDAHNLTPDDTQHPAYCAWVKHRVELARRNFADGKRYLRRTGCLRGTLAGLAYVARFEAAVRHLEAHGYNLRAAYPARGSLLPALHRVLGAPEPTTASTNRTLPGGAG